MIHLIHVYYIYKHNNNSNHCTDMKRQRNITIANGGCHKGQVNTDVNDFRSKNIRQ